MIKKIFILLTICSFSVVTSAQEIAQNMEKLGGWFVEGLPDHFYGTFNEVWGYADDNGEYAIMGSASYIHVINVTDPSQPEQIAQIEGGTQTVWRDFKTYRDRAYCVADGFGEGLIILDLSDLPNSVNVISQIDTVFTSSHNCFIDEANGRLYIVAADIQADILVYDIATDPDNPAVIGMSSLIGGGIHDLYVRDHIVYASSEYDGFFVYDLTDPNSPITLASLETNGYNHSNWVSEDGSYAIFAEEVPNGLPLGVMDLKGMMDNNIGATYFQETLIPVEPDSLKNTPHNPYLIGDLMITSYYEDGVHVYDMGDLANPELIGYYDTYPDNDNYNGYSGCWGLYPYLPSGNLLASDMTYGLFVLQYEQALSNDELENSAFDINIYPNPTQNHLNINFEDVSNADWGYRLSNLTGQILMQDALNSDKNSLDIQHLVSGIYFLSLTNGTAVWTQKVQVIK